ncbi:MAG: HTTM domain-containing protein [Flavobacteriales bacterium]
MMVPWNSVKLFRVAIHLWVIGFLLSALPEAEWLWEYPVSPALPTPPGPFVFFTHAFTTWVPSGWTLIAVPVLLLVCVRNLLRPARWWSALPVWMLYTSLMNHAWMAGSGGQQLISNLLFWLILVPDRSRPLSPNGWRLVLGTSAFWILRLQLLLAYAATGLHKLTGTHWLDGTALGIVATDPAYGPAWLVRAPAIAMTMTWAVLLFQLSFPIAVWFRRTRIPWMVIGVVFHLGTAISLGIPEMALAFISAYAIWLSDEEALRLLRRWFSRRRSIG